MITRGMLKEYLKYIVPTMITFTLGGVYSIIDGVFVGHAVGDAGWWRSSWPWARASAWAAA